MKRNILAFGLALGLVFSLCACGNTNTSVTVSKTFTSDDSEVSETESIVTASGTDLTGYLLEYKDSDYYEDYTEEEYTSVSFDGTNATVDGDGVTVSDGSITITEKGTYVLTGNYTGSIIIKADEEKKVKLVLNNVTIESPDGPAIYEESADKLVIMLPEGTENTINDSTTHSDDTLTAAIYAVDSLSINGTGSLTVYGNYKDAIVSKDNLKIMDGTINVNAVDDGLVSKDSLAIAGGDITVSAGDDAIHANDILVVEDGNINVTKSYEGLEAVIIIINGGDINVVATDDGINANGGNDGSGFGGMYNKTTETEDTDTTLEPCIYINGGNIYVNASGDGIDSNGSIEMNGGYCLVSGPSDNGNNATDYQDNYYMNGGVMIACGSSGMYQSISSGSACYAIDYMSSSTIAAGTECSLYDGDTLLYSFTCDKRANAILISSSDLTDGSEYTLVIGDNSETVTAAEGSSSGMGGFGGGHMGGGKGGMGGRPGK